MKPVFNIAVLVTVLRKPERRFGKLETEQSQILGNILLQQLEELSVVLLDFTRAENLSKRTGDLGWKIYETEVAEREKNKPQWER